MIGVGERAGGVEFMLEKLAEYYELDADAQADRMSTAAYFVVYLAVAITVGIVVISFWAGYWRMIGTLIDST
jgi:type IV pilus assembly protein PilC